MLDEFEIAKFVLSFLALEEGHLPEYKGSVLRGGFGYVFRNIVCFHKQEECQDCSFQDRCAYSYIFETSPTEKSKRFSSYSDVPRPFVVEPSNEQKRSFAKGDSLQFGLVLIGKAIEYFPYFVFCFDELGKKGLGRERVKFRLQDVCGFDFEKEQYISVYETKEHLLKDNLPTICASELTFQTEQTLSLEFLTPTRIKYRGKYISDMEFHVMLRNLLRRISMLMLFHCETKLEIDNDKLIKEAKMVDVLDWNLQWNDWVRYSTRQNTRMKLGGFIGNVTYTGELEKFMPFVTLGEQIHLGKNTTFGLGNYKICD